MNRSELLDFLKKLSFEYKQLFKKKFDAEKEGNIFTTVQKVLEEYLAKNKHDTQIWMKLALLFHNWEDEQTATECLDRVLAYEPNNGIALVLKAAIEDYFPVISDELYAQLEAYQSDDNKIMSLIEYMKAWYFIGPANDRQRYEQALKKSVEYCDQYVANCESLTDIYFNRGDKKKAQELYLKTLTNIQGIIITPYYVDFLNVEKFINQYIARIWLDHEEYESMIKYIPHYFEHKNEKQSIFRWFR